MIYSCMPNVDYKFKVPSFSHQAIATRDIKPGEQLFGAYCGLNRTKTERQTDLVRYGFSCNCPACANATPATDKLRKTFNDQISRYHALVKQPGGGTTDVLSSVLLLETEMVAEGLDCTVEFCTLLTVIHMSFSKLGRRAEMAMYEKRLRDYLKIHAPGL